MSPDDPFYEQCRASHRPAETPEDALVEQAGWTLFQTYEAGWGAKVIYGLSGHDGMCRPMGYQVFVFVNGAFAGTISPAPMDSRTDGGLAGSVELHLSREPGLTARFARYSQQDPLCCPSRLTTLDLKIEQQAGGAVLVPAGQPVTTPTES